MSDMDRRDFIKGLFLSAVVGGVPGAIAGAEIANGASKKSQLELVSQGLSESEIKSVTKWKSIYGGAVGLGVGTLAIAGIAGVGDGSDYGCY